MSVIFLITVSTETNYSYSKTNEPDADSLTKLSVSTKLAAFIPIKVEGHVPGRKLYWWWKVDSKDILFQILKSAPGQEYIAEHPDDYLCWPKFRVQTDYVPEWGEVGLRFREKNNIYSRFQQKNREFISLSLKMTGIYGRRRCATSLKSELDLSVLTVVIFRKIKVLESRTLD